MSKLVLSTAILAVFLSPGFAGQGKLENQGCYSERDHVTTLGKDFVAGSFEDDNMRLPDTINATAFPALTGHCMGGFSIVKGQIDMTGACEFADQDGSTFVVRIAQKGDPNGEGNWSVVGGTKRYDGISGEGKFQPVSHVASADGKTAMGCDHVWGTYNAPGIK